MSYTCETVMKDLDKCLKNINAEFKQYQEQKLFTCRIADDVHFFIAAIETAIKHLHKLRARTALNDIAIELIEFRDGP